MIEDEAAVYYQTSKNGKELKLSRKSEKSKAEAWRILEDIKGALFSLMENKHNFKVVNNG